MAGYRVGSAYVPVTPDFRGFHRKIGDEFRKETPEFEKWGDQAGARFTSGFQDRLRAGFAKLPHAKIEADADTAKAGEEIDRVARNRRVKIKPEVDWGKLLIPGALFGAAALGPSALGLGAGVAGAAVALGAAGTAAAAFGAIAVPMFKRVTAAQQAFTTATKQYDQATTKAQRASALKKEQVALAGLTPAEQKLSVALGGLKDSWGALQKAEEPVVARSLVPWFDTAEHGFSFLPSLIRPAATGIETLGDDARNTFTDPFWSRFFRLAGDTGKLAVAGFGEAVLHLADGLGHLFVTFKPDIDLLPRLVNGWSKSFDNWATHYSRSGFDAFMRKTFSPQNVANLKQSLSAAGTLLGNTAKAVANISPAALGGLSNVLVALSRLTPGQIEALGILYTASKVGSAFSLPGLGKGKSGTGILPLVGLGPPGAAIAAGVTGSQLIQNKLGPKKSAQMATLNQPGSIGPEAALALTALPKQSQALGMFLTRTLPGWWSVSYEDFQRDFAGPLTHWFTVSLPHALSPAGVSAPFKRLDSVMAGWGRSLGHDFGQAWDSTSGWVQAQFGKGKGWVTSKFSGAAGWLTSHGVSAAHGLANGFGSAAGAVRSAAGRAKGWVTGAVSGAGGWLTGAGEAVMSGFLSGIKRGWGAVTSFVSGVGSWIASHKGPIDADYRLLQPHGRAIMGGLQAGMTDGWRNVQQLTRQVTASLGATPLPATMGAGAGIPAVQVQVLLDGQAIEPRMHKVVVSHDRKITRRVLAGAGAHP